ncbi:MAG: S-layer homology domain-containing protein [Oscillospiraceae bacterium]|nr:S-layer homology domain-containing protein [Oscillospiraceae bacterium]
MRSKSLAAMLLSLVLLIGVLPAAANAADGAYVLMNIPYAEFYRAELGSADAVDAVSAATPMKRSNGNLAKGSYHVGAEGAGVDGVIYPVHVSDLSVLDAAKEITDASGVDVTTTARGTTTTTTYAGKDALFEAPDYSWYKLSETPAYFKELSVASDGAWSFGAVQGEVKTVSGVTAELTYNGRHTDVEFTLSGTEGVQTGDAISGVIVTTKDGAKYALGHVTNIWRAVQLGWNGNDVMKAGSGAVSITNIRYITPAAVIDYPVSIEIAARDKYGYTDVDANAWYVPYLDWATAKGYVTSAKSGSALFGADNNLSRAEIVTDLWNAAGKPAPETAENPFPQDVDEKASYYKAVLWALEQGITSGTGTGFSPDAEVDRATMVTFLWKQAGKPAPKTAANPFADVAESAWYRDAVLWAVENGITDGTGSGTFSPAAKVTRAQMLGFLFKSSDAFTLVAGKNGTTYVNLFEVILDAKYDALWEKYVAEAMGTETADASIVQMLKTSISGEVYGEEAAQTGGAFDCWFINGAKTFAFHRDMTATVTLTDGTQKTYTYRYKGPFVMGKGETMTVEGQEYPMEMACEAYRSTEDAGEFNCILLMPDTMASTYHIEFRYGTDLDALTGLLKGPYAYWLAAGIDKDADEETINKVIQLFCTENVGG